MAIQIRRGASTDFDSTKMVAGELAVSTDGTHKVWATGTAGDCWELASTDDVEGVTGDLTNLTTTAKTNLVAAVNEVDADLMDKITEPASDGTSGQVLATDGNGGRYWTNQSGGGGGGSVTVDSSLSTVSENPVQNKVITTALNTKADTSDMNSGYHSVSTASAQSTDHTSVTDATKITFVGNSSAFKTARYVDAVNLNPSFDYSNVINDVTIAGTGNFLTLNGTAAASETYLVSYEDFTPNLSPGTYRIFIEVDPGTGRVAETTQVVVTFYHNDDTNTQTTQWVGTTDMTVDVTVEKDVRRIAVIGGVRETNVYTGYKLWFGIFKTPIEVVNTNQTIPSSGTYEYTVASFPSTICTMQHESTVTSRADIKNYVDTHIPANMLVEEDLVYVSPEMYGAVGDGVTDDYSAITQCIAHAITNHVPVRGFGKYYISSGLVIEADNLDLLLEELITRTTTSEAVVKLTGYRNRITINYIYAYDGDCHGFYLYGKTAHWSNFNTITVPCIYANRDAILVDVENSVTAYSSENRFYTQYLRSENANCIHSVSGYGENQFFGGGQIVCPNGWAVHESCEGNKYYNLALEVYVRSGVYLNNGLCNSFYGFRIAELRGAKTPGSGDLGTMIKFVGNARFNVFDCADIINYIDIDVSQGTDISNLDADTAEEAYGLNFIKGSGVRSNGYMEDYESGYYTTYGRELVTLRNLKIVKPIGTLKINVSSNIDYRVEAPIPFANWFTITQASTIYLSASYCCIGFNHVVVDQTTAKADIYDKDGTLIFNGTALANGLYVLECACDSENNILHTLHPSIPGTRFYDGQNDVWTIYKIPADMIVT